MSQPARIAAPSGTHEEILARTHALLPKIRERAIECEKLRKVPRETVDELVAAGIVTMMLPKRIGGSELDYVALCDVISAVGSVCASTSWALTNFISCNFSPCYWPAEVQDELWSKSANTILAGSLIFSGGKATRTKGGYKVTGRWPLVSGCDHADWLILSAFLEGATGDEQFLMYLAPKKDYQVLDTWHATGLKGSGSADVVMTDMFVPEHRTLLPAFTRGGDSPGAKVNTGWLYRMPIFSLFSTWVGATVLGTAQGALHEFVTETRKRATRMTGGKMADFTTTQVRVAEATCAINAARALIYGNVREAQEIAKAGGVPSLEQKLLYRAHGAYAGELCRRAVDLLHRSAGGQGVYESSAFSRHCRDMLAGTSHITQNFDMNGSFYGRFALGLPVDTPLY